MHSDDYGNEPEETLGIEFPPGMEPGAPSGAFDASGVTPGAGSGIPVGASAWGVGSSRQHADADADVDLPTQPWTPDRSVAADLRYEPDPARDPRSLGDSRSAREAPSSAPASSPTALKGRFQVGGRNLLVATIVAVVLLGFIIASLIWVPWVFVGFAAIFVTIGVVELNNALLDSTAKPIGWIVTVFTPIILVATYLAGDHLTWASPLPVTVSPFSVVIGAAAVVMLLCCVWRLLGPTTGYVNDVSTAIFVLVYLPVLGSSIVLLMLGAHPVAGVLMCLVCPIANDTGAYALGVATASTVGGNHKMAPRISPAKSWEGFVGGLVVGTAAGAVFSHFALDYSWLLGAICGLLLSLVAVFGDLIESIMKRDAGLKDFGHIIPGHGGAMDRLDSIIFVAPVFYLFTGVVG